MASGLQHMSMTASTLMPSSARPRSARLSPDCIDPSFWIPRTLRNSGMSKSEQTSTISTQSSMWATNSGNMMSMPVSASTSACSRTSARKASRPMVTTSGFLVPVMLPNEGGGEGAGDVGFRVLPVARQDGVFAARAGVLRPLVAEADAGQGRLRVVQKLLLENQLRAAANIVLVHLLYDFRELDVRGR